MVRRRGGTPGGYDPGGSDDSGSDSSGSAGGGLAGGGGDSFTGDPSDVGGGDDPEPDPEPTTPAGPGLDPGAGGGGGGSDPDPEPSTPAGPGLDPGTGGGGSPEPEPDPVRSRVDQVTSGVGDVVDSGVSGAQDVVSDVAGGVDRVSDTLPGATGTAFAAGAGLAAVPEPTPATEISGGAIAGGAALVGGGILASRALRDRGGEVGIGERVGNELEVGQSRQDVTEVEPGTRVGSELEPGATSPVPTEVGVGSTVSSSEVDVPSGTDSGLDDVLGTTGVQIGREEGVDDGTTITRDDLIGEQPDIDQPGPSIREQQRREDLTAPERDFPTGESAVIGRQTASEIADSVQEPSVETTATGFGTGVGFGQGTDPFLGGGEFDDEPADGTIERPVGGTGVRPDALTGPTTEPDTPTDVGTGTEPIGGTGTGTDTGTEPVQEPLTASTVVSDVAGTQPQAEAVEATPQAFASPELVAFESPTVEVTGPGSGLGSGQGRRPRDPEPDEENEEQPDPVGFGFDADQFGSGLLSGEAAADDVLGDLRF